MDRQRFTDGSGADRSHNDDDGDDDDDYDDDKKDLREYFFKLFSNRSVYDVFESQSRNSTHTGSTTRPIVRSGQELLTNSSESILSNLTTLSSDWTIDQADPCIVFSGINHTLGNATFWDNSSYPHEGWIGQCNLSDTTNHGEVVVPMDLWQVVLLSTLAGCTSLITIVGNLIVLLSFIIERSIRQPTNYFIASLAVSDLIIGSISMPFYTLYLVAGQRWNLGPNLCDLWLSIDYTVCMASIYTVFCITIDRFCSVIIPAKYRDWRTERKVLVIIATTWIIPISVFFMSIFGWQYIVGERTVGEGKCYVQYMENPIFNCLLQVGYFWITLIIMFILYTGIYRVALRMAAKSEKKYKKMTTLVSVAGQTMTTIGMNIGHRASLNPDCSQQSQNCVQNSRLVTVASVTSSSTTDDRKASAVPPLPDQLQRPPGSNDPHHLHPKDCSTREVLSPPPSYDTSSGGNNLASSNPQHDRVECPPPKCNSHDENECRIQGTFSPDNEQLNFVIPSVKFEDQAVPCSSDNACEPLDLQGCSSGSYPCLSKCEKDFSNLETPGPSCTDEKSMNNSNCSLGVYDRCESRRETSDDDDAETSRLIQKPVNCSDLEEGKTATGPCQAAVSTDAPVCENKNDDPFSFPSPKTYRRQLKDGDKASLVHQSPDTPGQNISASAQGARISDKSTEKHYRPARHDGICSSKHGSKSKSKESISDPKNRFFLNFRNREYFRQKRKQQLKNSASTYGQPKQQGSRLKALKRYFSESDARRGQRSNSTKSNFSEKCFRSGSEISKQSKPDLGRGSSLKAFIPLCFSRKTTSIVITPAGTPKKQLHSSGGRNKSENRARKALRTITIILGAFVVCWTPWHVLSLIIGFKGDQLPAVISGLLYDISYWLCYLNSPINPFCYALANQQFKKAFSRILKLHWHRT